MITSDWELKDTLDELTILETRIWTQVEREQRGSLSPIERWSLRSLQRRANSLCVKIARYRAQQSQGQSEQASQGVSE